MCIIFWVKLTITIHTIICFTCRTFVYKFRVCYIGLYYTDMLPSGACVRACVCVCVCVCTCAHAYMLAWVQLCHRVWVGVSVVGWLSVGVGRCVCGCVGGFCV